MTDLTNKRLLALIGTVSLVMVALWAGLEMGYRIGQYSESCSHRLYVAQLVKGRN